MADPGTFEAALAALEERVRLLESGELPLDQALSTFEDGVALARRCHELLDEAEQRVSALTRGTRGIETRPLAEPEG